MLAFLTLALTFVLAQQNGGDGGEGAGGGFGNYALIFYIVIFIAIFYFLLIRPGQKQRKAHQDLVQSVRKGDDVMTTGGLYGTVTKITDDYVMLEIAKKTEVKVSRNAVARRESVAAEVVEEEAPPAEPEEEAPPSEQEEK